MTDKDHRQPLSEDAALRAIVEGVEAETGDEFFASLVRHLAAALAVPYAFVSEIDEARTAFRTVALWGRGRFLPNLVVPLAGSPCEAVLNGEMSHHPDCLQELFPEDKGLADWGVVSYCGVPLLDRNGVAQGHLAIFDDKPMRDPRGLAVMRIFAARARAELARTRVAAALGDSERRFRDLYDEAPVAYLSVGTDARIRAANRRAADLFGYPLAELIGRPVFDLYPEGPTGKAVSRQVYERFLAGIETVNEEIEGRRADGQPLWISLSVRPIRDTDGRIYATRSTLVDITERRRMEAAIRVSEERLSKVLDSAMDAIITFAGGGRVELFNAAAERAFRCAAAEAIGGPVERFLTEGFRRALDDAVRDGRPYVWAPDGLRARRADGAEFAAEATVSRVDVGGRLLSTLILRDVDDRRKAEAELGELHRQNVYLQEEIKAAHNFDEIIGRSAALRAILDQVGLVAKTDSSVLIWGETGTGKELIARAVHSNSARKQRPLIKVNCAALPTGLVESELFGHERGAFTGATERRIGRFELANGGTLFLDEIGDVSADVQAKLLRVLQERELERVGGSQTVKVDVRLIAATNRDLAKAVEEGTFRQDLFYRLNVFPVVVPPLRARPEDIPLLVHYFTDRYAAKIGRRITRVPPEAMARLASYAWPGNVRELENVVERAVILSPGPDLQVAAEALPAVAAVPTSPAVRTGLPEATVPHAAPAGNGHESLEDIERGHIVSTLRRTNWRIDGPDGAARMLSIHPSTLRSRMRKLGIRRSHDAIS